MNQNENNNNNNNNNDDDNNDKEWCEGLPKGKGDRAGAYHDSGNKKGEDPKTTQHP